MIQIITDSSADISKEYAEEHNIRVMPFHLTFKNEEFLDGVTINNTEFYEKLIESDVLPKTSQISPFEWEELFNEYPDKEIICITLSSKLSGTCQSANIAIGDREDIAVVDSLNATIGQKILVELAVRLVEAGKGLREIEAILNEEKMNIRLVALLDTLEYLRKGGRINSLTASVGTFLQIKPVVEVINGEVILMGKARGSKNGQNKLRERINEYGVDFDMPFATAYSGLSDHILTKYIEDSKDLYPSDIVLSRTLLGSTIGTHIGPGAIAVAFFTKKK